MSPMRQHDDEDQSGLRPHIRLGCNVNRIPVHPKHFNDYITLTLAQTCGLELHHHHGYQPCLTVILALNRTFALTSRPNPRPDPWTRYFAFTIDINYDILIHVTRPHMSPDIKIAT
ncbi:Lethal(3)Malignant Brain Tumor-Like Protein 1 [Manis pentadactyla]|nr:Lethal(3)Malignant Brain Tumor-Like Protein 1 [Manis pentadactyla]